ncbi:hypothetical protein [Candidatus Mycoplasma haematohominis]|uniref:Uncharacterized protein n=1 Tax=Candidatus Mycoplasma haematohominis TaxID=1494318 RepID=A0A478FPS8_9MOLU|nr:hypothetical protein [Candidatus Mycoplasma haemohominis]GCE63498.1 hypothetical protein MHSWG343_04950 [Candidatus Mycoplasma haemohominis]
MTKGYSSESSDETTALNKVCDSNYKKSKTEFSGDDAKATLKAEVERFCTLDGKGSLKVD